MLEPILVTDLSFWNQVCFQFRWSTRWIV